MSNFNKFCQAITTAKSARRLNHLGLEVIQDRSLLPMELYHLGRLDGMRRQQVYHPKPALKKP